MSGKADYTLIIAVQRPAGQTHDVRIWRFVRNDDLTKAFEAAVDSTSRNYDVHFNDPDFPKARRRNSK